MFVGRSEAPREDPAFTALEAVAEGAFCLGAVLRDGEGRASDLRVLRVGRGFEERTGLRPVEGRPLAALIGAEDRAWLDACGEAARSGEPRRCALRRGTRAFEAVALPGAEPGAVLLLLREAPGEAEALRRLHRELSHRVMNSFAALSAMVAMEARAAPAEARPPLLRLQGRVQAMGALYRQLDGGGEGMVDAAAYLRGLAQSFAAAQGPALAVEAAFLPLVLPARRAAPLGLLVYELLADAAARAGEGPARLRLALGAGEGGGLRLVLEDDAPGTGAAAPPLAAAFASELGGALSVEEGTGGRRATLSFRP